jgi:selenocysteine-specific elongation factor
MIVTLAGHVDHGKSTLIESLTGVATDRLAEERRRGLTIDLGFAYLQEGGRTLGFVDVPGHHRFIHNMVAGVAAHQHALLTIAVDDGPMPQSREHLQILSLIGVTQGTVALTKCDRVSADRVAEARAETDRLLAGSFLAGARVFETAAVNGAGIDALRNHLLAHAAQAHRDADDRPFRLAIDRAFFLKGAGLVATGSVLSGSVSLEQTVYAFPSGAPLRVRGLHVQNQSATDARAGDRAAINLAGADATVLARGSWLTAAPETGHTAMVARIRLLEDFPRALRHWSPVHVYHATSHSTARLALLQGSRVQPGEETLVQLELADPLPVKHGDRLVIRDQGLDRTIGGGAVIDNRRCRGRRRHPDRLRELEALEAEDAGSALDRLLAIGPVAMAPFRGIWNLGDAALERAIGARDASVHSGQLIDDHRWAHWSQTLLTECEARHRQDAALQGLRENDFEAQVPAEHRGELLNELVAAGRLLQRAGRYQPKQHRAALSDAETTLLNRLRPLLDQAQPPSLGDIGKALGVPLRALQTGVRPLIAKGAVTEVNERRLYLPERLERLADVAESLSRHGPFTARAFRDAAKIGRNIAIDVLEFFDARKFTQRQGETRTVVGEWPRIGQAAGDHSRTSAP